MDLAEIRAKSGIDEVLAGLDRDSVGLETVKTRIAELASLLLVDKMRARFGIEAPRPNLHMCLPVPPGPGDHGGDAHGRPAPPARPPGGIRVLSEEGSARHGHPRRPRGQHVGHTAPKTKGIIKRAPGGLLFIDEAHYLYKAERAWAGSIEILLQVMENNREDLVVVLAGYAVRMDVFFKANPGMSSRIAHHITFPGYNIDELEAIGLMMTAELQYGFSPEALETFRDYLPPALPPDAVTASGFFFAGHDAPARSNPMLHEGCRRLRA